MKCIRAVVELSTRIRNCLRFIRRGDRLFIKTGPPKEGMVMTEEPDPITKEAPTAEIKSMFETKVIKA